MTEASTSAGNNTISQAKFLQLLTALTDNKRLTREAAAEVAELRGRRSGIFKTAEGLGANKKAMRMLDDLSDVDEDERVELMDKLKLYAGWASVQLWTPPSADQPQGAMFAETPEEIAARQGLEDARVYNMGWNSAKAGGEKSDCPYDPGERNHQTWTLGFDDCREDRPPVQFTEGGGIAAPTVASTARPPRAASGGNGSGETLAPKRRGRPPKAAQALAEETGSEADEAAAMGLKDDDGGGAEAGATE